MNINKKNKAVEKYYLTKETLEKLKKELQELKTKTVLEVAQKINQAASFGDLSENAAYAAAREEKNALDEKIFQLEQMINNAILIDKKASEDKVTIGSTVVLKTDKKTIRYTILDPLIANPAKGIISYDSPLGQMLLNHKKGDIIELIAPKGRTKYKIVKIV